MPQRTDGYPKQFSYTKTNPEKIVSAKKGSWFFRKGKNFYLNESGNTNGQWHKLPYKTVILPRPPPNKIIHYEKDTELWLKTTDGFIDPDTKNLLPKTGWTYFSDRDVFAVAPPEKSFNWIFPPPTSTNDPTGIEGNRSYDDNFFYAKISGKWYRTPLVLFNYQGIDSPERPDMYTSLPFCANPRWLPVPPSSYFIDSASTGEQTYDMDFFYVKNVVWSRIIILMFRDSKMTIF